MATVAACEQPPELIEAEPGRLWVARERAEELAAFGLVSFRAVMDDERGEPLRKLSDRENWRLALPGASGTTMAYLKKHHEKTFLSRLRALCGAGPAGSPGRIEAENTAKLTACGVLTMRPIAFGESLARDGLAESFVMTEALRDFTPLDDFLRIRFPLPTVESLRDRRSLLQAVARVASRLHAAGFNHRDLYCCHFFVRESERNGFEVRLIDLQRVQRRRWLRRRWIVKDLAQLAYSAPRPQVRTVDALWLFKQYLGVGKLRPPDKRLWRRVSARVRGMQRKLGGRP